MKVPHCSKKNFFLSHVLGKPVFRLIYVRLIVKNNNISNTKCMI